MGGAAAWPVWMAPLGGSRAWRALLVALAAVGLSLALASGAFASPTTGAIAGTVTEYASPHDPIAGIEVCAYTEGAGEEYFESCTENGTNGSGEYEISGLPSGEYEVEFEPPFESEINFLRQFYDEKASYKEAQLVTVSAGSTTEGIDARLKEGGRIEGVVTKAPGGSTPIAGVSVCAYGETGEDFGCVLTKANGEYTIAGLASDSYLVEFAVPFLSTLDYVHQFYDGASTPAEATAVSVLEGGTKSGIDARLEEGGLIAGRVTDSETGAGISEAVVCALVSEAVESCAVTGSSGGYEVLGLATGSYKVEFIAAGFSAQFYNGKSSLAEGQSLSVTAPGEVSPVDAALHPSPPPPSPPPIPTSPKTTPPVNTTAPSISGSASVGATLSCVPGLWSGTPTPSYSYSWLREGTAIGGASGVTYTVQSADAGHTLSCRVAAKNSAGERSATSGGLAIPGPSSGVSSAVVSSPPPGHGKASVVGAGVLVSGRSASVKLKCTLAPCTGSVELTEQITVTRRVGGRTVHRRSTVVLAKGSYSLAAGKSKTIFLRLTQAGRQRLRHVKHHPLGARLVLTPTGGKALASASSSVRVT